MDSNTTTIITAIIGVIGSIGLAALPIFAPNIKSCCLRICPCCGPDGGQTNDDPSEEHEPLLEHDPSEEPENSGVPKNAGQSSRVHMINAKDLDIEHINRADCWILVDQSEPRFTEVAELLEVWYFEIKTSMNFLALSANTEYGAYLIFKITEHSEGLHVIMNTSVSVVGRKPETKSVCLKPTSATPASVGRPEPRSDGWLELELGKFHCDIVSNKDAVITIQETERMDIKKVGLIVAGIEIRAVN